MSENKILLDTSALIEFFDLTQKGREVENILNSNSDFCTPTIAVAELISKLKRKKFEPEKFVDKLESSTLILPLDVKIAKRAGELHAELKKKVDNISLADCIIMAHAENEDAVVVTCDHHFESYKKVKIL